MLKYFQLTKVDERTHTIDGLVTAEIPDKDGEICDYAAAKAAYIKWSGEAKASTEAAGQAVSLGNIRMMHQAQIAGKATGLEFRDDAKEIHISTEPATDAVWQLAIGGFIRGFSQGGDYAWRHCNTCGAGLPPPNMVCSNCKKVVNSRYAPIVAEVSYVDNPALGAATFSIVKADGIEVVKTFAKEEKAMENSLEPALASAQPEVMKGLVRREVVKAVCEHLLKEADEKSGLKKGLSQVAAFADLLQSFAWLQMRSQSERDDEGDNSTVPEGLLESLRNLASLFVAMATEEAQELTAAAGEEGKGEHAKMAKTETPTPLAKAAKSLAEHINKAKQHVADHHAKMDECFGKMHKAISGGAESDQEHESEIVGGAEDSVKPISPESEGTPNLYRADEVKVMIKAAVDEAMEKQLHAILKAASEDEDEPEDKKPKAEKAAKGVGDRSQLPTVVAGAGPVVKVVPVTKAMDGAAIPQNNGAHETFSDKDIMKAMSGDPTAALAFMKSVRPQDIPQTVAGALSK